MDKDYWEKNSDYNIKYYTKYVRLIKDKKLIYIKLQSKTQNKMEKVGELSNN